MKKINLLLFPVIGLAFVACNRPSAATVNTSSTKENEAIVRAAFEAFNQHDWSKMASYYAEPAVFLDPEYGTEYVNKTQKESADNHANLEKFSPDIKDSITTMIAAGDKVAIEFISSGITADKKHWKLPVSAVLTLKNGKIIKDATYYNHEK
ncbi:nuclear transport factor 2 family protein [Mucilaginibacter lacusdianchii]|uniref:nuclear transport factor 2 family protein n=1 Tax=Mucilaginibacter lacusdianchii TaxID=2684211 RepID=UPI00131BCF37|nr:nuclear transport factor 2 family protein [Mucilaginibacter sp. JXJ CY 39]